MLIIKNEMDSESEQITRAVFSITAKKGTHALLLGSGVSKAAHIPTGWDIVMDLTRKLSIFTEGKEAEDVASWYKNRFNKDPDYSDILLALGKTPAERNNLLCGYFEPNAEESRKGWKKPTATHKSVAALMASGIIKIVLTTNFDRLLEKALSDMNVSPIIIKQANDLEGISSLIHVEKPLLVKINGDYLDSRIKNTPSELNSYEPQMENLLSQVFAEFGLIIAGWSGKYDTGLIECYKRNTNKFFSTYWIDPYPLSTQALDLLSLRDGTFIKVDSDAFFSSLTRKISQSDIEKNIPINLPVSMSSFIGREKEIGLISNLLSESRIVTLLGPGGTGKTRLSVEVAKTKINDYPDGVFFADLTSVLDGDHLARVICSAIRLPDEEITQPEKSLLCHLTDKKILIVLDNCEQIVDLVSTLICKLVACCENVSILTTSRETLFAEGERVFKVLPLSIPDPKKKLAIGELIKLESVRLFCERAKYANPMFVFEDSNKDHVSGICHGLDGMPLAIELAAARTRVLTPKQIQEKLTDRFRILTSSMRNIPTRQQTLQATIDWSFCMLNDKEKALFLRLSMFAGGFTMEMAEQICPDDSAIIQDFEPRREPAIESWEIIDLVQSLCDKSLIWTNMLQDGSQRFSMYETIKEYAKIRFADDPDSLLFRKTLIMYFFKTIEILMVTTKSRKERLDYFSKEYDNIEESITLSMKVGLHMHGFKILLHFCDYLRKNELHQSAIKLLEYAIKYEDACEKSELSLTYYNLGWMQFSRNNFSAAKESFLKSLDLAKKANDKEMMLRSYHGLVFFHTGTGDYHEALEYNNCYFEAAKDIDDEYAIIGSILNSADISMSIGKFDCVESYFDEYNKITSNRNLNGDIGLYNYLKGHYYFLIGNYSYSKEHYLQALDFSKENNDLYLEFDSLFGIAMTNILERKFENALEIIPRIEQISSMLDDRNLLCGKCIIEGNINLKKCKFTDAINDFSAVMTNLCEYSNANHTHMAMLGLGQAQNRFGQSVNSRNSLETLLKTTQNFRIRLYANLELAVVEIVENIEKAMQIIEDCAKESEKSGNSKDKAEIMRIKAICLLKKGDISHAIKTLEAAIDVTDDEFENLQCKTMYAFALCLNNEYEKSTIISKNLICQLEQHSMLCELQIVYYSILLSSNTQTMGKEYKAKTKDINSRMGVEISLFEKLFQRALNQ